MFIENVDGYHTDFLTLIANSSVQSEFSFTLNFPFWVFFSEETMFLLQELA